MVHFCVLLCCVFSPPLTQLMFRLHSMSKLPHLCLGQVLYTLKGSFSTEVSTSSIPKASVY